MMERTVRIELTSAAWKAAARPLDQARKTPSLSFQEGAVLDLKRQGAVKHGVRSFLARTGTGSGIRSGFLRTAPLILALSGCASTPVTVVEKIQVKTFVPVPATLTVPISVDLTGATWGSAVGSLNAALQTCDARLDAIGKLKPPPSSYRR